MELSASTFLPFVHLTSDRVDLIFSDNYFDMAAGEPRTIAVHGTGDLAPDAIEVLMLEPNRLRADGCGPRKISGMKSVRVAKAARVKSTREVPTKRRTKAEHSARRRSRTNSRRRGVPVLQAWLVRRDVARRGAEGRRADAADALLLRREDGAFRSGLRTPGRGDQRPAHDGAGRIRKRPPGKAHGCQGAAPRLFLDTDFDLYITGGEGWRNYAAFGAQVVNLPAGAEQFDRHFDPVVLRLIGILKKGASRCSRARSLLGLSIRQRQLDALPCAKRPHRPALGRKLPVR